MDWVELSAEVSGDRVEDLCSALENVAPGGCSIEDPIVPLGPEEGVRREPWRPSTVRIYLPVDVHIDERRRDAAVAAARQSVRFRERPVREADWASAWKEFFQVEQVGRHIVVRPTWREFSPSPEDVVLHLDPGMAFGTGQHETTRMCLVVLEELAEPGMRVLDVGCGSGILSVAAARLGAASVTAVDLDSVAVEATAVNAARNGVAAIVQVAEGSLDDGWPFGAMPSAEFDLVLANIHAAAAETLAPAYWHALRPGGTLVASGMIAERLDGACAALSNNGFDRLDVRVLGEWRTVVARRPDASG